MFISKRFVICALAVITFLVTGCSSTTAENTKLNTEQYPDVSAAVPQSEEMILVAREGKGALYQQNGNRILVVKGTPYEMGYQHGVLLKESVIALTEAVLRESEKEMPGLLEQIWEIQKDYIPERYLREMEGIAEGSGLSLKQVQLANIMPEQFHCSGIAVFGDATLDGELFHGRILDYSVDYGLQDHAVVIVAQPDGFNGFINASFAGSIGSVTGMNDQKIAVGEMGGGGEGKWEGIPMSFLVRMALEEADTLKDGIKVFKDNDRTCEYYYVISDGNDKSAVAIYATPIIFETLSPGKNHLLLPAKIRKDTLIVSGSSRFIAINDLIDTHYGKIDKNILIEIMKRPVSMESNLHNAIFAPEAMIMWLAVAKDPSEENFQACYQSYYEYDMMNIMNLG
ncbi:MAG: C45 family autoproteolytic acyltransferase/hydrolase [Eubacteriales bacterium]